MSLPSRGVNGARPLLESPVELPAGLSPRKELLLANGREGISDCDCGLDDCGAAGMPGLEEGTRETSVPDGGRDILLSNTLGVEGGRVLYKSFEDPQLAFTEGESGTALMRGTGGTREEREDREVETTDEASDLSFDGTLGC